MYYFAGESYRDKQRLEREKNFEAQHKRRKATAAEIVEHYKNKR